MAVQAHRSDWSDQRLDDLNQTMREGFARTDADMRGHREEMRGLREEISDLRDETNARFREVDSRFGQVDSRFDSLQRTLLLGMIGLVGTVVASALATIVALA